MLSARTFFKDTHLLLHCAVGATQRRGGVVLLSQTRSFGAAVPINVQLDYYMSPQFSGIAVALDQGLYNKHEGRG